MRTFTRLNAIDLVDDPRWRLAKRIADSRSIGRSPLMADFLLHVCDRQLRSHFEDLTEQRIGVEVFGRQEGYNSNEDNIVRNYARMLRKRIDDYFATEGRHESLRLEIPRGAYVPVFSENTVVKAGQGSDSPETPTAEYATPVAGELFTDEKQPPPPPIQEPAEASAHTNARAPLVPQRPWVSLHSSAVRVMTAALITIMLGAFLFGRSRGHRSPVADRISGENARLWSEIFQKDRDTFLVPADSGLVILEGLTREAVPLTDYAGGDYNRVPGLRDQVLPSSAVQELSTRRYTSIVDLSLVSQISRLPEVVPERMLIRYARDLRMDDLRSGNAILLGSVDSNPWEELFEQQLNFRFQFDPKQDTAPVIENVHPRPGEQPFYANRHRGDWHNTFGLIAFLPNLSGTGNVLIVGGLNMAGTQAAGDFLLNASLMGPILERARSTDGTLRPFEVLVTTDNIAANASRPHVVSERIGSL